MVKIGENTLKSAIGEISERTVGGNFPGVPRTKQHTATPAGIGEILKRWVRLGEESGSRK